MEGLAIRTNQRKRQSETSRVSFKLVRAIRTNEKGRALGALRPENARGVAPPRARSFLGEARTMTDYKAQAQVSNALELPDPRALRGLCERMIVDEQDDGTYAVASSSGNTYDVDLRQKTCTCYDFAQRGGDDGDVSMCKHLYKVAYTTGAMPVSVEDGDIADAVREEIGADADLELDLEPKLDAERVAGEPRHAADMMADADAEAAAATDGGEEEADEPICGAPCKDGSPCEWPRSECPVDAHADHRGEALDDGVVADEQEDDAPEPPEPGDDLEAERDLVERQERALADERARAEERPDDAAAVADGGAGDVSAAVSEALDATDSDRPVVIVINL